MDESDDQEPDDEPPASYLSAEYGCTTGKRSDYQPSSPAEWVCDDCGRRVTRSPSEPVEYGHARHCDHSINRSPALGGDGA